MPLGAAAAYRARQTVAALLPRRPRDLDQILAVTLTSGQAAAFRDLTPHDQAHLCRVYLFLRHRGVVDEDLLVAALLHDLGKVDASGRVRLIDRIAKVILGRIAPRVWRRLARSPAPRWRRGMALAAHHPAIGAERAAALGCSPRTCWLIAHHEDDLVDDDPDLQLLWAADHAEI